MFCTHCGTEANANDRFYHSCGRDLSMAAAAPSGRDAPNAAPIEAVGRPRAEQPSWESPGDRSLGDAQLAGTGRRIGAFAIDLIIAVVTLFAFATAAVGIKQGTSGVDWDFLPQSEQDAAIGWAFLAWAFVHFAATWVLNATGASLGKRIVGLRIVRDDLRSPGISLGLGRTLGAWLSWPVLGLGFLWGTWDSRHQTWHDKMATTYVVRADSLPSRRQPPRDAASLH